jgi:ribosomal protein S18 acetylase RimI-like enzyme
VPLFAADDSGLDDISVLVNRAYRGTEGWTHEGDYMDGDRTSPAALRADLLASPRAMLMTLRDEADGPLLGVVWLEPAGAEAWYLGLLTVRPDIQGQNLGRRMLQAAETFLAERGARRVRMTVLNVRAPLIAWYERRGYRVTGETQPFPYEDQRFGVPLRDDLVFLVLEKPLAATP